MHCQGTFCCNIFPNFEIAFTLFDTTFFTCETSGDKSHLSIEIVT